MTASARKAGILFAAGAFTGIMTGTGMLKAMAETAVSYVPPSMGQHIPVVLGLLSMPLSMLFDPDSFYFGVCQSLRKSRRGWAENRSTWPRAALLGQMTTGFPVSPLTPATFLIVGLAGVELSAHQRFSIPYLLGASVLMTAASVVLASCRSDGKPNQYRRIRHENYQDRLRRGLLGRPDRASH